MLKLLICDDDQIILEGLSSWISENHKEFQIVGCAINGNMATSLVSQHRPDLIITDICMPNITGLELIDHARKKNPYLQSIIISGYDDFKYARHAVRLGAMDFLLKPIDLTNLELLLNTAVANFQNYSNQQTLQISDVLKSVIDKKQLCHAENLRLKEMSFPLDGYYQILIIDIDKSFHIIDADKGADDYSLYKDFNNVHDILSNFDVYTISRNHSHFTLCITAHNKHQLQDIATQVEAYLNLHNQKILDYSILTLSKSNVCEHLSHLYKAYAEALTAQRYKYIMNSTVIDYQQILQEEPLRLNPHHILDDSMPLIKITSNTPLSVQFSQLTNTIMTAVGDKSILTNVIVSTNYTNISKELNDYGMKMTDIFPNSFQTLKNILLQPTTHLVLSTFYESLLEIQKQVALQKRTKNARSINRATEYIAAHFADSDLCIEDVSKIAFMSTNHFSVIFKEETKQTFTEYLIKLRMERAKALIENTSLLFYEVSASVGYPNAQYFSYAFKKYTGKSPSEYKSSL